jgi:hypothetical protein
MRELTKGYHNDVLAIHNAIMFDTLIYPFNITTETAKKFTFEDQDGSELREQKGYLALKEIDGKKQKYFIPDEIYSQLPVRINQAEEIYLKDSTRAKSIIIKPTSITPFRIRAEKCFNSTKEFVDTILPFQHTNPEAWTLNKMIAIMGYVGKTFVCECSKSEFGKSSVYIFMDAITKKSPVFQPRSVPGTLAQITSDGNMVLDEIHECEASVKKIIENMALQLGGGSPTYINGAMKATGTKARYDVSRQSMTFLYNVYQNYKDPEKEFFDFIFSNNVALDSRFLKLKLDGVLLEKFDKDFNMVEVAERNKMFYMKIAKHLLWLKNLKEQNPNSEEDFKPTVQLVELKGRRKIVFDEIVWIINQYAETQEEFDKYYNILEQSIIDYRTHKGDRIGKQKIIEEQVE